MKKLLGILVLGLLLSGCGGAQSYNSETKMWNDYLNHLKNYKVGIWGEIYNWKARGFPFGRVYAFGDTVELAMNRMITGIDSCDQGCLVLKINTTTIDEKRQKELLAEFSPPGYVDKFFPKTKKVTKKTTTKKTTTKKTTEKKVAASSGSAFFVSNTGYIITNFHVIETCNDNSKIFYKTNKIDTKLIAKDEYLDLALLKAEVSNNKFIRISNKAPRKLQRIIAAGYPFGKYLSDDMKFTSGIVSSLKGIKNDSTRLQIDAALNPGISGGPIVDENTGELVAVAVAGLRKDITESVNYGIKSASVKNFLESNQIDPSTFSIKFGIGNIAEHLENTVLYTFCH